MIARHRLGRVLAVAAEAGEIAHARVARSADVFGCVGRAGRERVAVREAAVRVVEQVRGRGAVADRHPLRRRGRLDVPVHHAAIAQVGDVLGAGVRDRDRRLEEIGRALRRVVVVHHAQAVAGDARIGDVGRDGNGGRGRVDPDRRDVAVAVLLVGPAGQTARRVRRTPALARAPGGRGVGVERDVAEADQGRAARSVRRTGVVAVARAVVVQRSELGHAELHGAVRDDGALRRRCARTAGERQEHRGTERREPGQVAPHRSFLRSLRRPLRPDPPLVEIGSPPAYLSAFGAESYATNTGMPIEAYANTRFASLEGMRTQPCEAG